MSLYSNHLLEVLEINFNKYNSKRYIRTDPLKFLYQYQDARSREVVGLVASSLAYGRVEQILKSISLILKKMGPSPYHFIKSSSYKTMYQALKGFKHRFTRGKHVANLLFGIKGILDKFGSLNNCFKSGFSEDYDQVINNLTYFVDHLTYGLSRIDTLIPDPRKKSACKRLNLFLRWMIRSDNIDTGIWSGIPASTLVIPLDTHMQSIGSTLGFTKRSYASFNMAIEITTRFKELAPDDPVKYDFSLTRLGILKETSINDFLKEIVKKHSSQ